MPGLYTRYWVISSVIYYKSLCLQWAWKVRIKMLVSLKSVSALVELKQWQYQNNAWGERKPHLALCHLSPAKHPWQILQLPEWLWEQSVLPDCIWGHLEQNVFKASLSLIKTCRQHPNKRLCWGHVALSEVFLRIWVHRKLQLSGLIQENMKCQIFLWNRDFSTHSAQPAGEEKLNSSTRS